MKIHNTLRVIINSFYKGFYFNVTYRMSIIISYSLLTFNIDYDMQNLNLNNCVRNMVSYSVYVILE